MNEKDYRQRFIYGEEGHTRLSETLKVALETRRFEIDLYWKRAGYFWTFIGVVFATYGYILNAEHLDNKYFLSFVVSCIGFVLTFAWFLANRGSKYWQENWENHVDMLEDNVIGPLFKTTLKRPGNYEWYEWLVTGPLPYSVSKINLWVNAFILCIWGMSCIYSAVSPIEINKLCVCGIDQTSLRWIVVAVSLVFCGLMLGYGKTYMNKVESVMSLRNTNIVEKQ